MEITVDKNTTRRKHLLELAEGCQSVYDDETARMLDSGPVARFALLTSEGSPESSYRDNPNLVARDTREEIAKRASFELNEGWCPLLITDLDTGDELGWSIKVEVD
jgi:hypothetical protein